jgi:hypothetical protein
MPRAESGQGDDFDTDIRAFETFNGFLGKMDLLLIPDNRKFNRSSLL